MVEFTQWRIVDSHWVNTIHEFRDSNVFLPQQCLFGTLADYFFYLRIDIPDCITYALGENESLSFKYRHAGGLIELFVEHKNFLK